MNEQHKPGVSAIAEGVRAGKLSPEELVRSLLSRIDQFDTTLQAWVTIDREEVLTAARQSERQASEGRAGGVLHGVPVGLKDIFYTAGMKTTACSKIFADFVPDYDATCVAKLKEAGAIILGKAVTTEFATSDPSPSRNPWNLEHTPGGSSSGSSVAVAAGMVPAALGSQTGGSTCRPAAYNGIVGLKPTYGRISRYGVIPVSWSLDTVGILVRSVQDAALMLQAMAGYDPKDPGSSQEPVPDYMAGLSQRESPPTIGVLRGFFQDRSSDEMWSHTEAMVQKLARAGATVRELELPKSFSTAHSCQRIVMNVECAAYHQEFFQDRADDYGLRLRSNIETGMLVSAVEYLQAQRLRREFRRDMTALAEQVDVLLTPTTPEIAPRDLNTTGDAAFQAPWTSCGLPTITIPSGLSKEGLPMGIQLAAPPFAEDKLLAAARWCEQVCDFHLTPPDYA